MRAARLAPGLFAVVALVALAATSAAADTPTGRLSVLGGPRYGSGGLADELGWGYAFGLEAGYQPMGPDQRLGWGASWSTMLSYYGSGSARVADQLALVEMDAGFRLRAALGERRRLVLFGGGGGSLLRMNEPVTRSGDRSKVGPWGTAGVEFVIWDYIIDIGLRYGTIVDGSGTIGLQFMIGRGV